MPIETVLTGQNHGSRFVAIMTVSGLSLSSFVVALNSNRINIEHGRQNEAKRQKKITGKKSIVVHIGNVTWAVLLYRKPFDSSTYICFFFPPFLSQ